MCVAEMLQGRINKSNAACRAQVTLTFNFKQHMAIFRTPSPHERGRGSTRSRGSIASRGGAGVPGSPGGSVSEGLGVPVVP